MGTLKTEQIWVPSSPLTLAHNRLQSGNRSPLESPPVAKKPLKTDSTMELIPVADKENRSILKPQRLPSVLGGANELGGASVGGPRTRSWPGSLRRVNFEHSVDVLVYDPADGDYVRSESHQLNTEPRDRKSFIGRTLLGRAARISAAAGGQHPQLDRFHSPQHLPATGAQRPPPSSNLVSLPATTVASSSSTSATLERQHHLYQQPDQPAQQDLEFTFFEGHRGVLRLKFTVPLGAGVAAGDALVKANVAGNKIRVLGTRTLMPDGGSALCRRHEFSWRYSLPMDVDPYAITARMDSAGNLFVEAPVKTSDRRRTSGEHMISKMAAL